jgi:glycosyltransferase involved in cell wall biosynthesis
MPTRLAVVIPAYRPSAGLIELVRNLTAKPLPAIVVVDDGSGPEFRDVFDGLSEFPNVRLLRHAVNLGKGAALKTAFNYVLCEFPDLTGVVTADADGQHHPDDIERVANRLAERPDALILGAREFGGDVPLRSKIGNIATRALVRALLGQKLADTQTGLRGIPAALLPRLLRVESTGYEFELEMLIAAHHLAVPIVEQTIQTIYERGNPTSHFNPLVDSMKIYFVLLRFGSVSLVSALLDNLVFILTVHRLGSVLGAQALGRVFSIVFNYATVRSSVFYSHQQHKSTLPKFLALTIASGTCAYGGIHLLSTKFGVGVVAAKLTVETFLFFVNFAVQRAFIFRPPAETADRDEARSRRRLFAFGLGAVLLAAIALEIYGFRTHDLFAQQIWNPAGLRRFERFAEIFALLSAVLIFAAPRHFGAIVAALLVVLSAVSVGPAPVLAIVFFSLSANALGAILLRGAQPDSLTDQVCATLLGAGVYTFCMTFLARLPLNYPAVWGAILAAPILLNFRGLRVRLAAWRHALATARRPGLAERGALAVLLLMLTAQWLVNLKPEQTSDGLAMHLAVPMNIAMHHQLTIEPARFVWAVMPMAADFSYSIAYLLGGEYAARLVVFAMLLAVCALLYAALRRWTTPTLAYLLTAAFVATPIVQLVTGALFVENFLAAMILGAMTAIWRLGDTGERRYFYLAMALGGIAMTVKFGALAFVLIAAPFAFVEARRHRKTFGPPAAAFALGIGLLLAMAAPPYAVAYAKTGNPVFPFLNTKFHSPFMPAGVEIRDLRFRQPLNWRTPYAMTFETTSYYEGQSGSLGFHWLALVPIGLLGFFVARRRPAVSAAIVAFGAGTVILSTEPNARYLYAAMPLVLIPVGASLAWLRANQRAVYGVATVLLLATTALDAYFLPSASYYHKDFSIQQPFSRASRDRYLNENAAIRKVIAYFNQQHAGAPVLLTHEAANAGLDGEIYENHWHQMFHYQEIQDAADTPALLRLFDRWKVRYFIGMKPAPDQMAQPQQLADMLANCTLPEYELGDYYLARLDPTCTAQSIAEPVIVVHPGYYDAYDPAFVYRGPWTKAVTHGSDRDTTATTLDPGASVTVAFEGHGLYYIYAARPDGGIAHITIDGIEREPIDEYRPTLQWQHKAGFCCFGPGRHVIVIQSGADKNPASSGHMVNVDSISVVD